MATGHSVPTVTVYRPVDLTGHCNNRAISTAADTGAGALNIWGNSLPAEQLPAPGSTITAGGVPYQLPAVHPGGDNVRCAGQLIAVPPDGYDWVHLLAASERRTEDTVALHFATGAVDFEALRVSDFWAEAPAWFGDRPALRTTAVHYRRHVQRSLPAQLWSQRVAVSRREPLSGIRLPGNVSIHIFALTLQATERA
jgi:hypothetical protein